MILILFMMPPGINPGIDHRPVDKLFSRIINSGIAFDPLLQKLSGTFIPELIGIIPAGFEPRSTASQHDAQIVRIIKKIKMGEC